MVKKIPNKELKELGPELGILINKKRVNDEKRQNFPTIAGMKDEVYQTSIT